MMTSVYAADQQSLLAVRAPYLILWAVALMKLILMVRTTAACIYCIVIMTTATTALVILAYSY